MAMPHREAHDHDLSTCPRCPEPAYYRVTTDELKMIVCLSCANSAKALELSVDLLQ